MTLGIATAARTLGGTRSGPRLATPGAVLLFAGLALMYWGLGIFRGEVNAATPSPGSDGTVPNTGGRGFGSSWGSGSGTTLSPEQVASIARKAGFSGDNLRTAVAIAKAESGLNPSAQGDVDLQGEGWGPSIGLFQIRCRLDEIGKRTPRDCSALTDPLFNARSAYKISNGGNDFSAWTQYVNGAYRAFIDLVS